MNRKNIAQLKNLLCKYLLGFLFYLFFLPGSILFSNKLFAQSAPVISYSPSTNAYATGTAITPLSPSNSGGAVLSSVGYGSATSLSASFNAPWGMAVDNADNLYVTDRNAGTTSTTVFKFNSAGVFQGNFGTGTPAGAKNVIGIVFDPTGNAFVLNSDGTVYKYNTSGVYQITITTAAASCIAANASGDVFVGASGSSTVYKINSGATTSSAFITITGTPAGLAVDASGNIYTVNTSGSLVRYNSSGTGATTLATGLGTPDALCIDGSGNLYVCDVSGNQKTYILNSSGATLLPPLTGFSRGVAIDSRGVIYTSVFNGTTINKYTPTGGYFISKDLPTGLSFDNTTGIISGTPTATTSSTAYKITGYNSSGGSTATVNISTALLAPSVTYTPSTQVYQINIPITAWTPVNTGSPATYTVSPTLPAGLSLNAANGSITGTPTALSGVTNYTVTATNTAGHPNITITISCISSAPVLSYSPSSYTYPINVAITALNPTNTGGAVTSWTITPALSAGLGFSTSTGTISGTPTATKSITTYTVTGHSSQGNSSAMVSITVVPNPPVISYATPQSYLLNTPISQLNPTNTGGASTNWSVSPTLPTGLSLSTSTGAITGTPTVSFPAANYTVTATNTSGSGTAVINITCYNLFTWVGGTSTDWNLASNWMGGVKPGAGDQAVFNSNYVNLPVVSTPASVGSIFIGSPLGALANSITVNSTLTVAGDITYQSDAQSFRNNILTLSGSGTISAVNFNIIANTVIGANSYTMPVTTSVTNLSLSGNLSLTSSISSTNTYNSSFTVTGGTMTVGAITTNNTAGSTSTIAIGGTTLNFTGAAALSGLSSVGTNTTIITAPTIGYTGNNNQTIYTDAAIPNSSFTSGISYTNIVFSGATGIKTALSGNINISGSFTNSLTSNITNTYLDLSAATTNFTGASQTLIGGSGTGTTFYNVAFSGSGTKTMSTGTFSVAGTGVLTMGSGITLATGGLLTLKSDATGTASVGIMPPGTTITGNVNAQRFVVGGAGKRGYRVLSSPVNAGGANSGLYSINYIANSSYITGTTPSSGGIDQAGNPTLYLFRENLTPSQSSFTTGNFRGVSNMGTGGTANITYSINNDVGTYNIPVGNGFLFFFRGDRSVTSFANETVTSYVPTNTTFSAIGSLNTGSITVKDWFTATSSNLSFTTVSTPSPGNGAIRGYNLIGNPYPATINWEKYNRNSTVANSSIYGSGGLPSKIYQFNSTSKQYATYTQNASILDTTTTVYTASPLNSSDGVVSNMIASGQGFFIVATSATQSLTFHESAKTSAQASTTNLGKVFAVSVPATGGVQDAGMRIKLVMDSVNTDAVVLILNSNGNPKYDDDDSIDLGGDGALVSLSSLSADSVGLTVNKLPLPKGTQLISRLAVSAVSSGTYTLKMDALENLPALYEVWLMDNFMKDSLDMRANTTYAFKIDNSNPATFGANRFQIVIRENPALGLHLLDFTADKVTGVNTPQVAINWKVENESNYTTFYVQRSTDGGQTFQSIGSLQSDGSGSYSFVDKSPVLTQDQYRLQLSDADNNLTYSSIVTVEYAILSNANLATISLYPNPVHDVVNITITNTTTASNVSYTITITNSSGTIITTATSTQSTYQNNVSNLLPGTYFIQVVDNNSKAIVGRSKFVKL